jgi:outer membrane cobalamin receptor
VKVRVLSLAAILLLFAPLAAEAQNTATLTGTLADPSGASVAGAEVSAQPLPPTPARAAHTTSAPDGSFTLTLPPGRYRVRIAHDPFARVEHDWTLAAGETLEWNVRLALERLAATVVVSAHAEPLAVETVAAPVTVITRAEIDERQAIGLGLLLASTPGFAFSRLGREGGVTTVFLGGGNSNFTKVLVDGTSLNEPGGAIDFSNFALDNVEKIEVVRGAESALLGSDAMTGVVQIFTHRGTTRRPLLSLVAEGGKFSTARGAVQLSGLLSRLDYSAAASRYETKGQGPNDGFRNTTLSGNFGWRFTLTNTLRLELRSASSDAGVPGQTLFTPPNLDQHNGLRNFEANLSWELESGPHWRHRLAGTETYIRQLFDNPTSDFGSSSPIGPVFCDVPLPPDICDFPFTVRNQLNRAGFIQQSSYLFPRGAFTIGYQYEVENAWLNGPHFRRNNHGGYLEARVLIGRRLTLLGGGRAEANSSFGTRVIPRAGFAYALRFPHDFWGSTRLRFSYGLGIKEPTMFQSFAQDPCALGNPDLRPERSRSVNLGADQVLGSDRVRVSADYFDNRFHDIVSFTFCLPGGPCPVAPPPGCPFGFGTFFNTDLARARGITQGLTARLAGWLRITGNYSYVASRVLQSPNAFDPTLVPGNRLFKRPVHSGNLVLNASLRRMNWNLAGYMVGRRTDSDFLGLGFTRNPGYARVDLAASYNLGRGVMAFGRIENLLGKDYQDSLGYPALGRHYRLGMKFIFGGEQ